MTFIFNTTNLRESLIREVIKVVIPPNTPLVNTIKLRNKKDGNTHGNWGYFYKSDYTITINVPQKLDEYYTTLNYTRHRIILNDRYEFLAAVIGHEYRHAWQWVNERVKFNTLKVWRERDAEDWEVEALGLWREYIKENKIEINEDEAKSQKIAHNIRWRDFK